MFMCLFPFPYVVFLSLSPATFRGATEPLRPDDPPPPNPTHPDPILTPFQTRFRPEIDPILTPNRAIFWGQNWVKFRSKSGQKGGRNRVGVSGVCRVHAKGVVLCERTCFCLLSAFYKTLPSKNPSKNLVFTENPYRRLLRTLLRSTYC